MWFGSPSHLPIDRGRYGADTGARLRAEDGFFPTFIQKPRAGAGAGLKMQLPGCLPSDKPSKVLLKLLRESQGDASPLPPAGFLAGQKWHVPLIYQECAEAVASL